MDLTDKVALVTGGTRGIGLATARALAAAGCRVAVAGRTAPLLEAATADGTLGGRCCDVTDASQVEALFAWIEQTLGPVALLVNSAGINTARRMMADVTPADFARILAVNTTGTFHCIHRALPAMRAAGEGLIVNILSVAGRRVLPLAGAPYCTSKFAAAALGTFTGLEEACHGVRVTNLYPGEANTPLLDQRPSPPPAAARARMLQPEDVAACVLFVARLPARAVVPELVITPPHMLLD